MHVLSDGEHFVHRVVGEAEVTREVPRWAAQADEVVQQLRRETLA
jgi:hypothetical protein